MKVTVLSENLQKSMSLVNHAISNRSQLPILSHVLLETKNGNLVLSSTDLEIGIESQVPSQVEIDGATTVPAKLFLELVNSLPQDKVTLETQGETLLVTTKKTKSTFQTTPKDEFPLLYEELGEKLFTFEKGKIKDIFGKIVFSASGESTRPALSGVLLKRKETGMTIVATDGYRLSLEDTQLLEKDGLEKGVIVPARVIREALSFGDSETIHLFISEKHNQVIFSTEGTVLVGRLIEAEFPNYEKVLPTDVATTISFDREELLRAVKVCSIFARETANIITLSLQKEKVIVSAKTPSLGENSVEVEAILKGEENEIAFNVRYLIDALSNIHENDLFFEMTGPLNPGVFHIKGNTSFLHLIMPIRTQG